MGCGGCVAQWAAEGGGSLEGLNGGVLPPGPPGSVGAAVGAGAPGTACARWNPALHLRLPRGAGEGAAAEHAALCDLGPWVKCFAALASRLECGGTIPAHGNLCFLGSTILPQPPQVARISESLPRVQRLCPVQDQLLVDHRVGIVGQMVADRSWDVVPDPGHLSDQRVCQKE
ncbi:uncharacterized protein LOC100398008 isoform X5 [Callithrix jacchus]